MSPMPLPDPSAAAAFVNSVHADRVREWLPEIPEAVAKAFLANRRLQPALAERIARHYEIGVEMPEVAPDDRIILDLPHRSFAALINAAGIVWHARQLRTIIDRHELMAVLTGIDEAAYRVAMSHGDLAPNRMPLPKEREALTSACLWRDGCRCFFAWAETLPQVHRDRIWLRFPPDFTVEPLALLFRVPAQDIIRKISKELMSHDGG